MAYITFSYRQQETEQSSITSQALVRGKMGPCDDWTNHQNFSQNWQSRGRGDKESLKFECKSL